MKILVRVGRWSWSFNNFPVACQSSFDNHDPHPFEGQQFRIDHLANLKRKLEQTAVFLLRYLILKCVVPANAQPALSLDGFRWECFSLVLVNISVNFQLPLDIVTINKYIPVFPSAQQ